MSTRLYFISGLILLTTVSAAAWAQIGKIPPGSRCFECGMRIDPGSYYTAEATNADGKLIPYCDIGDLLASYREIEPASVYVRDYISGDWIDAKSAFYVKSDKFETPMSWGIAAFKNESDAGKAGKPMSFEQAIEEVNK